LAPKLYNQTAALD